ncbi:MAG: Uma2 family endonuclease [Synechococcus sp.]|nr:Uma2 family endonuclease [Synechococcus sp.]
MIANLNVPSRKMTPEEYLDWEDAQGIRYEYVDGETLVKNPETLDHARVYLNLYNALSRHLAQRGCEAFVADVKVQDQKNQRYFYPDLVVTCHPDDRRNNQFIQHPTVIVEVLSPSTANYDQSRKLKLYRQIPSLQEYILIDSQQISVALYQRQSERMWGYSDYGPEESFLLPSIEFECAVADLYANAILETSDNG